MLLRLPAVSALCGLDRPSECRRWPAWGGDHGLAKVLQAPASAQDDTGEMRRAKPKMAEVCGFCPLRSRLDHAKRQEMPENQGFLACRHRRDGSRAEA